MQELNICKGQNILQIYVKTIFFPELPLLMPWKVQGKEMNLWVIWNDRRLTTEDGARRRFQTCEQQSLSSRQVVYTVCWLPETSVFGRITSLRRISCSDSPMLTSLERKRNHVQLFSRSASMSKLCRGVRWLQSSCASSIMTRLFWFWRRFGKIQTVCQECRYNRSVPLKLLLAGVFNLV